jgi:hypothetical protein
VSGARLGVAMAFLTWGVSALPIDEEDERAVKGDR